jgi:hypothetical protein
MRDRANQIETKTFNQMKKLTLFKKRRCEKCDFISGVFELTNSEKSINDINKHRNFRPIFFLLKHFEEWGEIELYAGDCTTKEFDETDTETHFTWCFYFKCKACGKYFFIGACIRGTPIYRIHDKLTDKDLQILWGKSGTYFEQLKSK